MTERGLASGCSINTEFFFPMHEGRNGKAPAGDLVGEKGGHLRGEYSEVVGRKGTSLSGFFTPKAKIFRQRSPNRIDGKRTQVRRTIRIFIKNLIAKGGATGRRHGSSPGQNQNDNVLLTLHVRSGGMRNVPHEPSGLDAIGINSSLALRFRTLSETTQFTALPMIFSFRR